MKGPKTTNKYGIVHKQNNSPFPHLKKRLKQNEKMKSMRVSEKRKVVTSLARQRQIAFNWLETEVANNFDTELPSVKCPTCKKTAFLCKTPTGSIAWSNTPVFPWALHACSVDVAYANSKLTDVELSIHSLLTQNYTKLRLEMSSKEARNAL